MELSCFKIVGVRDERMGTKVRVIEGEKFSPLRLHLKYCDHSPTGFEWGYGGSGPAQLSFEILFRFFRVFSGMDEKLSAQTASQFAQDYKWQVISRIKENSFEISGESISLFLKEKHHA